MSIKEQILIIKHGALGDVFLALPAMDAIREKHPEANIVVLTTPAYVNLFSEAPFCDEVWVDERSKIWHIMKLLKLRSRLANKGFSRVYDLQTSQRTSYYFKFWKGKKPEWSGVANGCSHNCYSEDRGEKHTVVRHMEQLKMLGIKYEYNHDLSWISSDIEDLSITSPYAIIVSGGSAHRPEKRWSKEHYTQIANAMISVGVTPVLVGSASERKEVSYIASNAKGCLNLCGRTSLFDLIEIAKNARYAVGNDTGPMHMIAAAGCRSVVLFSNVSNPKLCAPLGEHVTILQKESLADLPADEVGEILGLAVYNVDNGGDANNNAA